MICGINESIKESTSARCLPPRAVDGAVNWRGSKARHHGAIQSPSADAVRNV